MFETPITVVGNIVTAPDRKRVGDQELIKFRVASNSRRRTPDGQWEPGNTFFVTVNCWGKLVTGVGAALGKGDAVIVVGHVHTSEYEDKEGNRRSSVEVRATSVGPDLARCIARIESRRRAEPADQGPTAVSDPQGRTGDVDATRDHDTDDHDTDDDDTDDDDTDDDSVIGGQGLPLTA